MSLRNTEHDYGTIARYLHWGMAILFLLSYCAIYYRHWFTEEDTPANWIALQLHLSIGLTIAAFVVLRIIWRLTNRPPPLEPDTPLAHRAARSGHFLLYVVMVVMPVTGYVGTGVNTDFFFLFEVTKFEDTQAFAWLSATLAVGAEEFEDFVDEIHETGGAAVVWVLIAGHAAMAVYHHFVKKDRSLLKMAGRQVAE